MTANSYALCLFAPSSRHGLRLPFLLVTLSCFSFGQQTIADEYPLGPDSLKQAGVPHGKVTEHTWNKSDIFAGTERDYWIYVPSQYNGTEPACLMVFQDGRGYVSETGHSRVPTVFDNLIHQKAMPVTIGIFINPGRFSSPSGGKPRSNRSFEYDTLSDDYARFLLEEILPEVGKEYKLTDDPQGRAICGASSGGICAFTVAWKRPDVFSKVISYVGSFTNIRGGHNYAAFIRKTEKKPIRVYLQDGENDLDNLHGHWPLANRQLAAALRFSGYDYRFEMGTGGHNARHGAAILPEMLRWTWRDYPGVEYAAVKGGE